MSTKTRQRNPETFKTPGRLSHEQRAVRRAAVANAIRKGLSMGAAAAKYEVSIQFVREACATHGVKCSLRK